MSDTFVSGAPVPPQGPRPQASQSQQPKRPKKPHPGLRSLLFGLLGGVIGAAAVVAVLVVGGFVAMPSSTTSGKTGSTGTTSSSQTVTVNSGDSTDTTLANAVAQKALPSVVSINVTTSDGEGVGSGVVLDTDGNIVTNYHVIEGAQSISVSTGDASYDATVVGSDESSDLAVIKIDAGDAALTPIEVGDSSTLQVGDWVMSLGSPFGLEQSVSTGIVSSLYRSTMLQNTSGNTIYTNLIQTDATINPGNSGGALVDDEGKLVGINSLIESYSGSSSGVGFAIPVNYAKNIADQIIGGKTPVHPYLGATLSSVNALNARTNKLSTDSGAYVASVVEDGPAAKAGIQEGDVITKLGDDEITSADGLIIALRSHEVGEKVEITLVRGKEEKKVTVELGSDEELQNQQQNDSATDTGNGGITDEQLRQYLEELLGQQGQGQGNGQGF